MKIQPTLLGLAVVAVSAATADDSSTGAALIASDRTRGLHGTAPMPLPKLVRDAARSASGAAENADDVAARGRSRDGRDLYIPFNGDLANTIEPAPEERVIWEQGMDRVQVADTTVPPYRSVGLIEAQSANGNIYYCTGTLVGPRTVLTAAHCLYSHEDGGWMSEFRFLPGVADQETVPFGVFDQEAAYVMNGFVENYQGYYASVLPWDLGILILSEPIGETIGWPAYGILEPPQTVLFVGYHGDKPIGTMWQETCEASPENIDEMVLHHQCYAYPGSNGGPLFTRDKDKAGMVALQVASSTEAALALLLTPPMVAWINQLSR